MADFFVLVRAFHILGAILWAGSTFMLGAVIFPALRRDGAEEPFLVAILRRGGFGPFYHVVSAVTVLSGITLYVHDGYATAPFASAANVVLTSAGIIALGLIAYTNLVVAPLERRLIRLVRSQKGPMTATNRQAFQALSERMGKRIAMGAPMLFIVLLLMLARPLIS